MAIIDIETWPPDRATLGEGPYFRQGRGDARVMADRPPGGRPVRDRPPFAANASPGQPPWAHTLSAAAWMWKNSVSTEDKAFWAAHAKLHAFDRWTQKQPTGNGWQAFVAQAFYCRWWNTDYRHITEPWDAPNSTFLDYILADTASQELTFTVTYPGGTWCLTGNAIHCFQIDPTRLTSGVPWRFTHAIGQFHDWDLPTLTYTFDFPAAYPFESGDQVGAFLIEHAGYHQWNRVAKELTAN